MTGVGNRWKACSVYVETPRAPPLGWFDVLMIRGSFSDVHENPWRCWDPQLASDEWECRTRHPRDFPSVHGAAFL